MNEFSIVCRILGSLFSRAPNDSVLDPLFGLLAEGKLKQHWPLEQDELLDRMGNDVDRQTLAMDYQAMFGEGGSVSLYASDYEGASEAQARAFLTERGVPLSAAPANGFGQLLLAASWIEDNATQDDEIQAQLALFDDYLFPWCGRFLGKVEAHATTAFYRALASVAREALQAMRDELTEDEEQDSAKQND